MKNPSLIHDFDRRIDTPRHLTVALVGAAAAIGTAAWAASYTIIPFGAAIFTLINFD